MKSWKLKQFIYIFQRWNYQTFYTRWNNHLLTLINYKWSPHYTWKEMIWSIWIHTGKLVPGRSVAAKRKQFLEHFLHLKTGSWPEIQSDSGVGLKTPEDLYSVVASVQWTKSNFERCFMKLSKSIFKICIAPFKTEKLCHKCEFLSKKKSQWKINICQEEHTRKKKNNYFR